MFAVDWFHSLAHLLIGAAGLAVHRGYGGSKAHALALGVACLGLFLLGIFSGSAAALGGLLPLNAPDDVLQILTSPFAFAGYFSARSPERPAVLPRT